MTTLWRHILTTERIGISRALRSDGTGRRARRRRERVWRLSRRRRWPRRRCILNMLPSRRLSLGRGLLLGGLSFGRSGRGLVHRGARRIRIVDRWGHGVHVVIPPFRSVRVDVCCLRIGISRIDLGEGCTGDKELYQHQHSECQAKQRISDWDILGDMQAEEGPSVSSAARACIPAGGTS